MRAWKVKKDKKLKEALLILLGVLFLLGAAIDWIQFQEELKDMRSEEMEEDRNDD